MNRPPLIPRIPLAMASALLIPLSSLSLKGDVTLPSLFSDHAVLQKSAHVPVWGKADPGEKVTVTFDGHTTTTTANEKGKWSLELDLKDSPTGPFALMVEGKNRITLSDVLVGEVWLASGQSNMEWPLKNTAGAAGEIARSSNPMLRQFFVRKKDSHEPLDEAEGKWVAASPETSGEFGAVAYYFSKKLQHDLQVPLGVIHSSWGGTPIEAWTSDVALDSVPDLKECRLRLDNEVADYPPKKQAWVEAMRGWLMETGRADHPVIDTEKFAGTNVDTSSWIPVTLPGEVKAAGLPSTGAVWLRKEIVIPTALMNKPLEPWFRLDGFDTVYWNGKKIAGTTFETFDGEGSVRKGGDYSIPVGEIRGETNVVAIRLFEPISPARFLTSFTIGGVPYDGAWMAKSEYELPAPPADKPAPQPLKMATESQNCPCHLYNGMIHPLQPYAIRGVIWYQGESNANRAFQYRTAFPLMIADWRRQWGREDLPFYYCQLANHHDKVSEPGESAWAELRDAQSSALRLKNTGQALLIDLGESANIHPTNKKDPGERLALIALARDYGKTIPYSGPVFDSMSITDGNAVLSFTHTEGGLVARPLPDTQMINSPLNKTAPLVRNSPGSQLEGFAICGVDKKWYWADARIEGGTVIVSSEHVPSPVAVRYAWADNPTCNLYNGAGLPACPFRTDDFTPLTLDGKY